MCVCVCVYVCVCVHANVHRRLHKGTQLTAPGLTDYKCIHGDKRIKILKIDGSENMI